MTTSANGSLNGGCLVGGVAQPSKVEGTIRMRCGMLGLDNVISLLLAGFDSMKRGVL